MSTETPITNAQQYVSLTSRVEAREKQVTDTFHAYAKISSAIIGGTMLLHMTYKAQTAHQAILIANLSSALMGLIAIILAIMTISYHRGWWGFRMELTRFRGEDGRPIPDPRWPSTVIPYTTSFGMLAIAAAFWWFNPFYW